MGPSVTKRESLEILPGNTGEIKIVSHTKPKPPVIARFPEYHTPCGVRLGEALKCCPYKGKANSLALVCARD